MHFTLSAIVIGDRDWLLAALCLGGIGLLLVMLTYWRSPLSIAARCLAGLLKTAGILLLAACLVNPLWSSTRARPGANIFALLVDNSQSLTSRDAGSKVTRGEDVAKVLSDDQSGANNPSHWLSRLQQDFDVRRYTFDARLNQTSNFDDVAFDGATSSLAKSLETLRDRFSSRPLAGVMLFSDGNVTDLLAGKVAVDDLPPVYPVVVGKAKGLKDVRIDQVATSQTSFEDAPITIRADVSSLGYSNPQFVGELFDEDGTLVESQTIPSGDTGKSASLRFQVKPTKRGVTFYRLRVSASGENDQFDNPESSREATLANNETQIKVDRGTEKHRILYVSGRPNWEFKFLRRAIEGDEQVDLVGLIRIARREPRFDFRGRDGETSNPLFRGFDGDDEETEEYDQPVLIRLNTRDADEMREGFPKGEEELFGFDAIIIDDLEAGFFTADQQDLIDRFVSKRGGGLLMLGGQESFRNGKYDRTPIGRMLPVYIDREATTVPSSRLKMSLTRDGWLQPWVRLRANERDEEDRLAEMPTFHTINRVGSIKPGAIVMASVKDEAQNEWPALIVQRYGRGRTAAMTVGDLWRWRIRDPKGHKQDEQLDASDLSKSWRQTIRWLVADVPHRIDASVRFEPEEGPTALRLVVRVRNEKFEPLDNASVRFEIQPPDDGERIDIDAEPSAAESGRYDLRFRSREPGAYRATAYVIDDEGETVGTAKLGWTSDPTRREFASVAPNVELMQELAEQTGGEILQLDDVENFASTLATRRAPVTEEWTWPLWHQSWVFLVAIGCFIGEWGIRRMHGAA